jgi:hypothetical protein
MKFTTYFGLRSQTTRLQDSLVDNCIRPYRSITFSGAPVMGNLGRQLMPSKPPIRHISRRRSAAIRHWTFPNSLAVTMGIHFGFFSSAY